MHRSNDGSLFWGSLLILLGCLFLSDNLGWLHAGRIIHYAWPLILVYLGFSIIRRSSEKNQYRSFQELGLDPKTVSSDSSYHSWGSNVFGDIQYSFTGQKLSSGALNTVFGNVYLQLNGTTSPEGTYSFHLSNVFGDLVLEGPKEFGYALSGSTVFGDVQLFENKRSGLFSTVNLKTPNYDTAKVKVLLHAGAVFGDVTVK